jgi:hypothetical protein
MLAGIMKVIKQNHTNSQDSVSGVEEDLSANNEKMQLFQESVKQILAVLRQTLVPMKKFNF